MSRESNLLFFKRVRKIIKKHSKELSELAKILNEKDKNFYYSHYLDYKYVADRKRHKNLNEFTFQDREPIKNNMDENFNKKRYVVYCKRVEDFIRLLEDINLVLLVGVSVGYEELIGGNPSLKILREPRHRIG